MKKSLNFSGVFFILISRSGGVGIPAWSAFVWARPVELLSCRVLTFPVLVGWDYRVCGPSRCRLLQFSTFPAL